MNRKARKLLQRIVGRFQAQHHGLVSQLNEFQISIIELADFSKKGLARGLSERPSLEDTLIDLQAQGYLRSADSLSISLTERGLQEGLRSPARRAWDFINRSPGIAMLISLCSLVVAILALLKK